jgi:hypothetical protein
VLRKNLAVITITFSLWSVAPSQIAPPHPESRWHHIFSPHREKDNLEDRYEELRCALVLVDAGTQIGTGFFISGDGDVVTAFHVLGRQMYSQEGGKITISLVSMPTFRIKTAAEEYTVPLSALESQGDTWGNDLAVLRTGRETKCWLHFGNDKLAKPGQHVVALGFPGLAFGSLSLYTGIISGRLKNDLVSGVTLQGQPLKHTNEFLRVQMPISTGISGGPVVDDDNRVIAVVTQAGAWGFDLETLTEQWKSMAAGQMTNMSADQVTTAHLAEIFHDYASPGYGDAVPLSYLKRSELRAAPKPETPAH